ncbi:MAG: cobalamin biosynthesis protein, partial [Candidatus Binataceae bacterium]
MTRAWHLPVVLIGAAILLDLPLGDPAWMPHPVRLIGRMIDFGETLRTGNPTQDLRRGALLAIAIVLTVIAAAWMLIALGALLAPALGAAVAVIIAWTTLAMRGLDAAAAAVQLALERDDLPAARAAMPALVGRDPASLDREGMVRASIESVAE